MNISTDKIILYITIMALVTYAVRCLPLTLMRREIKSVFIRSFLYYIPYAVLGAMTIPDIFYSTGSPISAAAGLIAAVIFAYLEKSLLTVAVVACLAVAMVQFIL